MANLDQIMDYLADSAAFETTSASASSSYSSGAVYLFKNKINNMIFGYGFVNKSSNIAAGEAFITVPTGWRPADNISGAMFGWTSGNTCTSYRIVVTTDGKISQNAGSTLRNIMFVFSYKAV